MPEVPGNVVVFISILGNPPKASYLRNPAGHKTRNKNYILNCIRLANLQLLLSGRCFGLDVENNQIRGGK
jgi:hypothetical protein